MQPVDRVLLCVQGQATDIAIQAEEILKLKRQINNIYAKHTGQQLETIGSISNCIILVTLIICLNIVKQLFYVSWVVTTAKMNPKIMMD